ESFYVRRSAIQALAAIGAASAAPSIEQRITDADDTIRAAACAALSVLLAPTSPVFIAPRLADPVPEVRQAAEDALLKFPPGPAWRPVVEASEHKDLRETRVRAWKLLGEYGHEETREHAFKHLSDKDAEIVGYAMRIMRKLRDERCKPHVLAVLTVKGLSTASEVDQQECFEAAILFKLKQPIPQVMRLLRLAIKPPEDFSISELALASAIKYLAAMDHKEAAPLVEQLYTAQGWSMESAKTVTAALTAWTGKTYPLPVVAKAYGHYFIDAYVSRDKPPTP
ncbi:MAG TPA: HEAT repeat domain-containing protein, partial [Candidatus Brocadiia bacterium]|nr:HEAT repeat domain-containing protein [Candidatus Brocadiia bacterium]